MHRTDHPRPPALDILESKSPPQMHDPTEQAGGAFPHPERMPAGFPFTPLISQNPRKIPSRCRLPVWQTAHHSTDHDHAISCRIT